MNRIIRLAGKILMCILLFYGCKKDKNTADQISFGSVTDIDGNEYKTVQIGNQTWTAENLKTNKLNDGTDIPNVTVNDEWINKNTPAYSWYDNDPEVNKNILGALYNWYAVNSCKLCPAGWHVPTDDEWFVLRDFIAADGYTNSKVAHAMKATNGWKEGENGTNQYGFSALPGGIRYSRNGLFRDIGESGNGYWWSATAESNEYSIGRYIQFGGKILYSFSFDPKHGASVRCVKN